MMNRPAQYKLIERFLPAFLLVVLFIPFSFSQVYLDPNANIEDRVTDLLGRMSLDEKIGQMVQAERTAMSPVSDIKTYYIGSLLSGGGSAPDDNTGVGWSDMYDSFQVQAMATPLKIPLIYGIDAVHGHNNVLNAVIFPHNIGLGCTRNPDLVKEAARITALEVMGTGLNWTFAPCIAVVRNERWGRTYEGFGETSELVAEMGAASIKGLQGDSLMGKASIVACAKHYIGDGGTIDGDDQGNTVVDEQTLRNLYLPAYIEAIKAGVGTVMASYSSWNGSKMHGHKYLLTDVLKTELGFDGFVISDYAAIDQLPGDYATQVANSINAGVDMVMLPFNYKEFISTVKTLYSQNKISIERIDDAVKRILRIKFRAGLFEHPYADRTHIADLGSDAHRLVARECVRQSLVLLKKKDNVLPLNKDGIKIHVAGKNANNIGNQCGGWTISWQGSGGSITKGTTVYSALKKAAGTSTVTYSADGSGVTGADVAVAVIGETPYAEGAGDRSDLGLSSEDIALVRKLKAEGIPVITVLISGRPMLLDPILHYSDAVVAAWLPGTEGDGVSDVLYGDYQPSGQLSNSWPTNMEQIPVNFGDTDYNPLFPYGYGITSLANSAPGSAPELLSALASPDGNSVELTFNKAMTDPSAFYSAFSLKINSLPVFVTNAELKNGDNTTIILTASSGIEASDIISVSYSGSAVTSIDGGILNFVSDFSVYNLLDELNYFPVPGKIEAEDYTAMSGVDVENTSDTGGGINVGWIDTNDWMDYNINIPSSGSYKVDFRFACESASGQITMLLDNEVVATVVLPVTGGWQVWKTKSIVCNLPAGLKTLRLKASAGGFNLNWFLIDMITSVDEERTGLNSYMLEQNFPNPFNPVTTIKYSIPARSDVKLSIYDLLGREVAILTNMEQEAGTYSVKFNSESYNLSSGIYMYKLSAGSYNETRKLILLK